MLKKENNHHTEIKLKGKKDNVKTNDTITKVNFIK